MRVTLRDVAKAAGVSLTAASMALNETGRLSAQTRQRVFEVAHQLGYRNRVAVPARHGGDAVGILMYIDADWAFIYHFIRPIIEQIMQTLAAQGLATLIIPVSRADSAADVQALVFRSRVIALAALHYGKADLLENLEEAGIPVVLVMNNNFQDRFYSVCVDDFQGAYEGACRLIRQGHRTLGYIECFRPDLPQLPVDRFFGFRKAVEEYQLHFDDSLRLHAGNGDVPTLAAGLEQLLARHPGMTGIFALDDELALRVVVALSSLGLRVPGDLSLIAPGDVLDYEQPHVPAITTMRIDTAYMGRICAQMLLTRIQHNPQEIHVLKVKQQLVRRGSVAPGPAGVSEGEESEKTIDASGIYPVERVALRPYTVLRR